VLANSVPVSRFNEDQSGNSRRRSSASRRPWITPPTPPAPFLDQPPTAESAHAFAETEGNLREAQGQLQLLGGAVLAERHRESGEQVERLRQAHQELEQHLEGHRVLAEVLKRLDAERSSHLGRALAKPVADRFLALVGGTYTSVRLGPSLRAEGVEAAGDVRGLDLLSVGTRDQLATLIRLAIAEHLRTALLLDDQLTQSDPTRMRWLRDALLSAAGSGTQILVLTCRPLDYLNPSDLPTPDEPAKNTGQVTAIDLTRTMTQRAGERRDVETGE
jgi:hypothetical protein